MYDYEFKKHQGKLAQKLTLYIRFQLLISL